MADDEQPAWEVEADDTPQAEADDTPQAPCVVLEACCDSRESVRNAVKGGALRVEICARASLHCGGLTPSPALVRAALAEAADVVALVRIRSGDFVYTEEELRDMVSEVRELRAVGCRGFALGCLGGDQCMKHDLHAIDATPARWRAPGGLSPLDSVRNPTHWLIYAQAPTAASTRPRRLP